MNASHARIPVPSLDCPAWCTSDHTVGEEPPLHLHPLAEIPLQDGKPGRIDLQLFDNKPELWIDAEGGLTAATARRFAVELLEAAERLDAMQAAAGGAR